MPRPQELKEPMRVNYVIEREQDKALRKLDKEQPVKGGLSGHVRRALDLYLNLEPEEREHFIPRDFMNVIALVEYLKTRTPKSGQKKEFELPKGELMLMFGRELYKMKGVVDMTMTAFNMKGIDALHEVVEIEVGRKKEKHGWRVVFPAGITRKKLCAFKTRILSDLKGYGRIMPITEGE